MKERDDEWLARLESLFPGVDIAAEIKRAERYVRTKRGEGAKLTRKFFEDSWLPGCDGVVNARTLAKPAIVIDPEPDGWRDIIATTCVSNDSIDHPQR